MAGNAGSSYLGLLSAGITGVHADVGSLMAFPGYCFVPGVTSCEWIRQLTREMVCSQQPRFLLRRSPPFCSQVVIKVPVWFFM